MGVVAVQAVSTERSVAQSSSGAIAKQRRRAVEAAKQFVRVRISGISDPGPLTGFVRSVGEFDAAVTAHTTSPLNSPAVANVDPHSWVFRVHHGERPLLFQQAATESARTSSTVLIARKSATKWLALIDSENGLTDGEIDIALRAGVESVTNAPATLRTETGAVAAFAAFAMVQAKLGSVR